MIQLMDQPKVVNVLVYDYIFPAIYQILQKKHSPAQLKVEDLEGALEVKKEAQDGIWE